MQAKATGDTAEDKAAPAAGADKATRDCTGAALQDAAADASTEGQPAASPAAGADTSAGPQPAVGPTSGNGMDSEGARNEKRNVRKRGAEAGPI